MKSVIAGIVAALLLVLVGLPVAQAEVALRPVPGLEAQRYMGQWYEIARFPNRFQKKCAANVSAHYAALPEGRLRVVNKCRLDDGSYTVSTGEARPADPAGPSSVLQVRFAPQWLAWLPMVWGDYWVIALDKDYRYSVVGTPDRSYLWILSRTPTLAPEVYEHLRVQAAAQGFDVGLLQKTVQEQ
ncbi:MAG: lipocalin family protein [Moraxellaceae bacterium]